MQPQKQRLGRGLAALIGDDTTEQAIIQDIRTLRHMPIELLHPSLNNPRKQFGDIELDELAKSIRHRGLLQPLVVRPRPDGEYEIVAGERRWRAAQRAELHEIPVLIRDFSDAESLEIALIENIQRSDLNPLEEAKAYSLLLEQFNYTQLQLAESVGKSRSHISNTLRLLTLPEQVRVNIESGKLTAGHARSLIATDSPAELAAQIIDRGLSVRESEDLARDTPRAKPVRKRRNDDANVDALEKALGESLGLAVEIRTKGPTGGTVVVNYSTLEQLEDICGRLQAVR